MYELKNKPAVPIGLLDAQIVLILCALDHLVKRWRQRLLINLANMCYQAHREILDPDGW